jgi:hypothetical protein
MSKIIDIEFATTREQSSLSEGAQSGTKGALSERAQSGTKGALKVECLSKIVAIVIMSLFVVPFGITSVYYAYTDNSCANLRAGKLYVNLKDYLAVNGILYLLNFVLNTAIITYFNTNDVVEFYSNPLTKLIALIGTGFHLLWTIVGSIIFWSLIDNNACDKGIYNYVFAQLIIQFVFIGCKGLQGK